MKKMFKTDWFAAICTIVVIVLGIRGVIWIIQHPYILVGMAIAGTFFALNADNLAKPITIPRLIHKRTSLKKIPEVSAAAA